MKEIEITDEVLSLANVLPSSDKELAWDTDTGLIYHPYDPTITVFLDLTVAPLVLSLTVVSIFFNALVARNCSSTSTRLDLVGPVDAFKA